MEHTCPPRGLGPLVIGVPQELTLSGDLIPIPHAAPTLWRFPRARGEAHPRCSGEPPEVLTLLPAVQIASPESPISTFSTSSSPASRWLVFDYSAFCSLTLDYTKTAITLPTVAQNEGPDPFTPPKTSVHLTHRLKPHGLEQIVVDFPFPKPGPFISETLKTCTIKK